ncbi:substrate-binding periplasmic protein [Novosphingobium mangrovi (ex Huang et al. 2023)]|uniref:Transporter substrate-binding domain-containing protein n=1 Tax=Novosphingobium mangrovi (ex Huang et al. 2023) TaxID=2976432 RepID=A0ABT2I1S9_9SPHN|nr:transporter substrate-binding domain-containing protein [Novosphingobium mangrovi (ex Huang et al. 2023)]MCT2398765.1 transporter substrate-binding domain-containing protein [Novosphingobium mangrovi (ex Huang et al. 2023)]
MRSTPVMAAPLEKVRELGVLRVGLYTNNRPWSWEQAGKPAGIDVDLAKALADHLGVRADIALFLADEEISDDLRNVVWRGGLLGFQPCDVMLHVPFDRQLMAQEDNVVFLAPYYRETFGAACAPGIADCEVPPVQFHGRRLTAELDSIPDFYLLGTFGGILARDLTHVPTGYEAVAALAEDKADVAIASRAQIEAAMADHPDAGIRRRNSPLPAMLSPGWDIGIAVKENSRTLGFALEEEISAMAGDGRMKAIFARHGVEWRPALAAQPTAS